MLLIPAASAGTVYLVHMHWSLNVAGSDSSGPGLECCFEYPKYLQTKFQGRESSLDVCTADAGMLCCMVAVKLRLKCVLQEIVQSARPFAKK